MLQVPLGTVFRSRFEVDHVLQRLAAKYRGDTYDIVRVPVRASRSFSREFSCCTFLAS